MMTTVLTSAYVGVGANLGDRAATIRSAIRSLDATPGVRVRAVSPLIETAPVGPADQPAFLNGAIAVGTSLTARGLLGACLAIETAHGRTRTEGGRWGPRTLDLDLLLYGADTIDEPGLVIPHPHLHDRAFVLEPLATIAPDAMHPLLGASVESLRDAVRVRTAATDHAS